MASDEKRKNAPVVAENSNFLSYFTFMFTLPIILKARKGPLGQADMFALHPRRCADAAAVDFERAWASVAASKQKRDLFK